LPKGRITADPLKRERKEARRSLRVYDDSLMRFIEMLKDAPHPYYPGVKLFTCPHKPPNRQVSIGRFCIWGVVPLQPTWNGLSRAKLKD